MYAQILTPMQILMLREAAASPRSERTKAIEETTELIKKQSPGKFFHYTRDGKADPAMRMRWFHDQPNGLDLDREYAGYNLPYAGIGQSDIHKVRNARLIVNHKKLKGEK